MAEAGRATASAVLRTLSALSPVAEARGKGRTIPLDWFRWLPANAVRAFRTDVPTYPDSIQIGAVPIDRGFGERLAAVDQIRSGSRSLRLGWLFVAGSTDEEGGQVRVFHPLVTIPVRVQRFLLNAELLPGGDAELSPLIADRAVRHRLEEAMEFGGGALDSVLEIAVPGPLLVRLQRLHQFARAAAGAAGFKATAVVPAGPGPEELLRAEHLQIVAGVAVFAVTDSSGFSRAASLEIWADTADDHPRASTAFHSLYLGGEDVAPAPSPDPVESPYVLTPTQRDAILAARRDPVTVVSGAPGTGKSHTIVAVACDALSRGESVLVAAKSDDPVDALIDLLERAPGPDPVVFGSGERRSALAKRLAAGQLHPLSPAAVAEHRRSFDEAVRRRDALRSTIRDRLAAEALLSTESTASDAARLTAPGLFDPHTDLEEARELWAHARGGGGGWIRRWREGKAWRALIELAQAAPDADAGALADALAEARAARIAADLVDHGGLALESGWAQLRHLDDEARVTCARWLAAACRDGDRINGSTLPAVTALATALRSGRAARRAQLARIDRHLIRALPLWIGSLPDIDDLLPPVPSLFDLVILDEASSIDQPLAAPALLRARRAVIVGDPHQLRHVSFLSDAKTAQAVAASGLDGVPGLASRLDVRRNSIFDVATGTAPVTMLDEHFRSAPPLIDWAARRIYDGCLLVATRTPASEGRACIQIDHVTGERNASGVVVAEVDEVTKILHNLAGAKARSVGVVSPFRAQADALEGAVLAAFSADDVEGMDLRVGTVHAFQGNERDVVVASLGVGRNAAPNAWEFVAEPHLFTVLVTRARSSFRIVTSADPPADSLIADYFRQADSPPGRPHRSAELDPWSLSVHDHLVAAGLDVTVAYPVGRHTVDLCVKTLAAPVSVECRVHPAGADAHIERHLDLMRSGWLILDAYRSKWEARPGELAVELLGCLKPAAAH